MYPLIFPLEPNLKVLVNGQLLGMLQSYQTVTQRTVTAVGSFGSSTASFLFPGPKTYSVTLHRLMLDFKNLPAQLAPYSLENFSLTIIDDRQKLYFTGCQWLSITESYELGQSIAEELRLTAKSCVRTALT